MRKWVKIAIPIVLSAAAAIVCAVRWQAWFGMPDEPVWTGDVIDSVLTSPTDEEGLTFLVMGDIHSNLTRDDYDTLAARVPQADVVLQTGDWMERGQEYYRQQLLREWSHSALNGKPVIACPGNHEYNKGFPKELSEAWQKTFYAPSVEGIKGANYYVDFPFMRLIVLDTNPMDRIVEMTRLLTWLRKAMYGAEGKYIVVMMHHPVLSAAKGRFNAGVYTTFRYALSQTDLVLCGHDHNYVRKGSFVMLNTAGKVKPLRKSLQADVISQDFVYGVLTADEAGLSFKVFRRNDGVAIDSLYVKHD